MKQWSVTIIKQKIIYNLFYIKGTIYIFLASCCQICYIKDTKGNNRPQGVDLIKTNDKITTLDTRSKFRGWFSYALKHYLINVNTNVSNARMNIPKAIRSLKSKCLISTTPILCRIEVSHPVTRLFLLTS